MKSNSNTIKVLLLCIAYLCTNLLSAADRYWVASANGNWNDPLNWSITSGGTGGCSVPTSSDVAIFDGNSSGNCILTADLMVDQLNLNGYTDTIHLNGYKLTVDTATTNMNFASGVIYDLPGSGELELYNSAYTYFSGTTFDVDITVTSQRIYLSGSTFNQQSLFYQTASSGEGYGDGGNHFNGPTLISNLGDGWFSLAKLNPDTFNSIVTFSQDNGRILIAKAAHGTYFNNDLVIESTSDQYMGFGQQGGSATLADGFTISIGPLGYDTGRIYIKNFVQEGSTPQFLTFGGTTTRVFLQEGCIWNGDFTIVAPRIELQGSTYNGSSSFTKTSNTYDASSGGNRFNGPAEIINRNTENYFWALATSMPDTFNNVVTFRSESGRIAVARNAAGTLFNDSVYVESQGLGVFFGEGGGTAILADGKTISIGSNGFTTGQLRFKNFTQLGSTPQSLMPTGNARLYFQGGTVWNGHLTVVTPRIHFDGSTFNDGGDFTKNANGYDNSNGGNTFNGTTIITQLNAQVIRLGMTSPDTFNGDLTLNGPGRIYVAYGAKGTQINGNLTVNSTNNKIYFAENGGSISFNGTADQAINVIGATAAPRIHHMEVNKASGMLNLNTPVSIVDSMTFTNGVINSTVTNTLNFEDNAIVSSISMNAYVDGPVLKYGDDAFTFPVGDSGEYRPINMDAPSQATDVFRAQYYKRNPDNYYPNLLRDSSIDEITACEFWMLDRIIGTSAVNVSLSVKANTCNPADPNQMLVSRWDGTEWRNQGGVASGSGSDAIVSTTSAVSNFSPFTFGFTASSGALPIELIDFTAELCFDKVCLNWETAAEINNDYFSVERSSDGKNWTVIQEIDGAGNSNQRLSYRAIDPIKPKAAVYYRLKQTDFDGQYAYSDVRVVSGKNSLSKSMKFYPNPTEGAATLMADAEELGSIRIFDSMGVEWTSSIRMQKRSDQELALDLSALKPGLYLLQSASQTIKVYKR